MNTNLDESCGQRTPGTTTVTRCGRQVNKLARFRLVNNPRIYRKEKEDVRSREREPAITESVKLEISEVAPIRSVEET